MRQYIPELMSLIVEVLLDGAAIRKLEVAVTTLGQVIQGTGFVTFSLLVTLWILFHRSNSWFCFQTTGLQQVLYMLCFEMKYPFLVV